MKFEIKDFLRADVPAVELSTIPFAELCKLAGADGLQPSPSARFGTRIILTKNGTRAQVKGADGKMYNTPAIRLGKSVMLENDLFAENAIPALKELVNNFVIYHGENQGEDEEGNKVTRRWIAFGKKGEFVAGKVYSLTDLMASVGATA